MNVLFIEPPPAGRTGGIETAVSGLAAALQPSGINVKRTDASRTADLAQADAVHFHGLWEPRHAWWRRECRRAQIPFVVSPHGMLEPWAFRHRGWKKRIYFHLVERRSLAGSRRLHATSTMEALSLRALLRQIPISTVPLGVVTPALPSREASRASLGLDADERCLLFLSRCHPKKGLHDLVAALPRIAGGSKEKIRLLVIGDGEPGYTTPLTAATGRWRTPLRAEWCGAVWGDAKWRYLIAADLFCLPTYSENFGLAILEALIAGTPVLTTDATPWSELGAGLPVRIHQPGPADLERALHAAMQEPRPTADERANTQRQARGRFDWTMLAPRYAELYRLVAQAH